MFEFLAYQIVINFITKKCIELNKWDTAMEFPDIIASGGRQKLHEIANFFNLAHHSAGKKGKSRRTLMYPRTLYITKQNSEKTRLEKERNKIRDKYPEKDSFEGIPSSTPTNFKDQVLRELWEEKYADDQTNKQVWVLIPEDIGQPPNPEKIQSLIKKKQADLEKTQDNILKAHEKTIQKL